MVRATCRKAGIEDLSSLESADGGVAGISTTCTVSNGSGSDKLALFMKL